MAIGSDYISIRKSDPQSFHEPNSFSKKKIIGLSMNINCDPWLSKHHYGLTLL